MPGPPKTKLPGMTRRVLLELPNTAHGKALWKSVKIRATEEETTMSAWVLAAIADKLTRKAKPVTTRPKDSAREARG